MPKVAPSIPLTPSTRWSYPPGNTRTGTLAPAVCSALTSCVFGMKSRPVYTASAPESLIAWAYEPNSLVPGATSERSIFFFTHL